MNHRTIRRGSRGHDVLCLQFILNQLMRLIFDELDVDGIFGKGTKRVVEGFQRDHDLVDDGIVGPLTWAALYEYAPGPFPKATEAETYANKPVAGAGAEKPKTAPVPLNVYLHGYDAPDKNKTFGMHKGKAVQHYVLGPGPRAKPLATSIIDHLNSRNAKMSDMVINTHGAGGGRIKVGKGEWGTPAVVDFVKPLKEHFLPGAKIRIYACLYASSEANWDEADAHLKADEGEGFGDGIKAMGKIAKAAGVPVSAGFRIQYGADGSFKGPCAHSYPDGSWRIVKGGAVSTAAAVQFWTTGMMHWIRRDLGRGWNLADAAAWGI